MACALERVPTNLTSRQSWTWQNYTKVIIQKIFADTSHVAGATAGPACLLACLGNACKTCAQQLQQQQQQKQQQRGKHRAPTSLRRFTIRNKHPMLVTGGWWLLVSWQHYKQQAASNRYSSNKSGSLPMRLANVRELNGANEAAMRELVTPSG